MHIDTDPTPAHGIERPTKTTVLDRLLAELYTQRNQIDQRISVLNRDAPDSYDQLRELLNKRNELTLDINDIDQLLIDMFPEPY